MELHWRLQGSVQDRVIPVNNLGGGGARLLHSAQCVLDCAEVSAKCTGTGGGLLLDVDNNDNLFGGVCVQRGSQCMQGVSQDVENCLQEIG